MLHQLKWFLQRKQEKVGQNIVILYFCGNRVIGLKLFKMSYKLLF